MLEAGYSGVRDHAGHRHLWLPSPALCYDIAFGKIWSFILKKLIPLFALVWLSERIFQKKSWKKSPLRMTSYKMNSASRRPSQVLHRPLETERAHWQKRHLCTSLFSQGSSTFSFLSERDSGATHTFGVPQTEDFIFFIWLQFCFWCKLSRFSLILLAFSVGLLVSVFILVFIFWGCGFGLFFIIIIFAGTHLSCKSRAWSSVLLYLSLSEVVTCLGPQYPQLIKLIIFHTAWRYFINKTKILYLCKIKAVHKSWV